MKLKKGNHHFNTTPTPTPDAVMPIFQEGVRPAGFKVLLGKSHEEFTTMRHQDAEEFLAPLLSVLRRHARRLGVDPAVEPREAFAFGME